MSTPKGNYWTLRERAVRLVGEAVRDGKLPRLDGSVACVDCGKPAVHYDHRDYRKPLKVAPVCRRCNRLRGPGLPPNDSGFIFLQVRNFPEDTRHLLEIRAAKEGLTLGKLAERAILYYCTLPIIDEED